MNYKTFSSLKGNTLKTGDLVAICSVGHEIAEGSLCNLGDCGDLWVFRQLKILCPESFVSGIGGSEIWIDGIGDTEEIVRFRPNRLDLITNLVLELMRLSEEQGWGENDE